MFTERGVEPFEWCGMPMPKLLSKKAISKRIGRPAVARRFGEKPRGGFYKMQRRMPAQPLQQQIQQLRPGMPPQPLQQQVPQQRPAMPPQPFQPPAQQLRPGVPGGAVQQQMMMMMQQRAAMPQQQMTQGDHLMMAKAQRQAQPMRGQQGPPPPLGPGGDFLAKLAKVEQSDVPNFNGITLDNWEQRSRNVGRLAAQNEAAETAAKQRLGLLPKTPEPPAPAPPAPGYSQAQKQLQPPGRGPQPQRGSPAPAQQQVPAKHVVVSLNGGGYDQWDERVPSYLAAGGGAKLLNAQQARQQSRGQASSFVFG